MLTGFTFSKIVIIESLRQNEYNSAADLHGYIQSQLEDTQLGIDATLIHCESAGDFISLVEHLTHAAMKNDEWPLLHIECHGDDETGIEFTDRSELSWAEVADALVKLNRATRFNLMTVFATCFGFHFSGEISAIKPSPCWCVIGPTDSVMPDEIARNFRTFYRDLFQNREMSKAVDRLHSEGLELGQWLVQPAEVRYLQIATGYIKEYCTLTETTRKAKRLRKRLKLDGLYPPSLPEIEATIRRKSTDDLIVKYFDRFFMVAEIPEGADRFRTAREKLKSTINELKATGKFGLASHQS